MKNLDSIDLEHVTGGAGGHIVSPCASLNTKPLGQATRQDLALANRFCGLKLPTRADKERARHIFF